MQELNNQMFHSTLVDKKITIPLALNKIHKFNRHTFQSPFVPCFHGNNKTNMPKMCTYPISNPKKSVEKIKIKRNIDNIM
jgi:predicted ATP-dependent protease